MWSPNRWLSASLPSTKRPHIRDHLEHLPEAARLLRETCRPFRGNLFSPNQSFRGVKLTLPASGTRPPSIALSIWCGAQAPPEEQIMTTEIRNNQRSWHPRSPLKASVEVSPTRAVTNTTRTSSSPSTQRSPDTCWSLKKRIFRNVTERPSRPSIRTKCTTWISSSRLTFHTSRGWRGCALAASRAPWQ